VLDKVLADMKGCLAICLELKEVGEVGLCLEVSDDNMLVVVLLLVVVVVAVVVGRACDPSSVRLSGGRSGISAGRSGVSGEKSGVNDVDDGRLNDDRGSDDVRLEVNVIMIGMDDFSDDSSW
jgi:hypothetical protein